MKIIHLDEIKNLLSQFDPIDTIEKGFVQYSNGEVIVPPVGELIMDKGEVHIKYGCLKDGDFYIIKIASGFYQNPALGLPSSNGVVLMFDQTTGQLTCLLLDEGYLTDIRTAIAGAIAAKWLAPKVVSSIGIIGTGIQAKLQPIYLKQTTLCRQIIAWGRNSEHLANYKLEMQKHGFSVTTNTNIDQVADQSNLIVTTTPATTPLLFDEMIRACTHITAVGSDTAEKQELDSKILQRADRLVTDSFEQCKYRGEIFKAVKNNCINYQKIAELGRIIESQSGRTNAQQLTVADLTGVAVQDIKIASAVYLHSLKD